MVEATAVWLATWWIHAAALVAGAWILSRLPLGWRPAQRDVIWKVAVVASLLTASVAVGRAGVGQEAEITRQRIVVASAGSLPRSMEGGVCQEGPVPSAAGSTAWRRACRWEPPVWPQILVTVWLLGAAVLLAGDVRRLAALRRLRRGARPARGALLRALGAMGSDGGGVALMVAAAAPGPCALPGGVVVVPPTCALGYSPAQLRAVLAHEVAHVRRRDPTWVLVFRLVAALLWMQPAIRWAAAWSRAESELACDDWAVARTGLGVELARCIEKGAASGLPGALAGAPGMLGRRGGTVERVRRLVEGNPPAPTHRWRRRVATAAAVGAAASLAVLGPVPPGAGGHARVLVHDIHMEVEGTTGGVLAREFAAEVRLRPRDR